MNKPIRWCIAIVSSLTFLTTYCPRSSNIFLDTIDPKISAQDRLSLIAEYSSEKMESILIHYLCRIPEEDLVYPNPIICYVFAQGTLFLGNTIKEDGKKIPHCFHYIAHNAMNNNFLKPSRENDQKNIDHILFVTKLCFHEQLKNNISDLFFLLCVFKKLNQMRTNKVPRVLIHKIINCLLPTQAAVNNIIDALSSPSICRNPTRKNSGQDFFTPYEWMTAHINNKLFLTNEDKKDYFWKQRILDPEEWRNNSFLLLRTIHEDLKKSKKTL